jgi:hypothetical protein
MTVTSRWCWFVPATCPSAHVWDVFVVVFTTNIIMDFFIEIFLFIVIYTVS